MTASGSLREERHAAQRLGREGGRLARHVDADPLGLGQLDLRAVDAIGAAVAPAPTAAGSTATAG